MKPDPTFAPRTLRVDTLTVHRGERLILDGVGFVLAPGQGLFLRGPNGSGKTTLLMALAGTLHIAAGTIAVDGRDPETERPGADIHHVGHAAAVKPSLTLYENLAFWAGINAGDTALIEPALEVAGLGGLADFEAGILSAGQTRRLALCRLLVAQRPIWLLDEPTSALDAQGDGWVAGLIADHLARGGLLVAATHRPIDLPGKPDIATLALTSGMRP